MKRILVAVALLGVVAATVTPADAGGSGAYSFCPNGKLRANKCK